MEPSPLYRPIRVVDSTSWDTQRGTHKTKQVHYMLYDGTKSYIEVPEDTYSVETIKPLLEHAAQVHMDVMGTQGPIVSNGTTAQVNPWGNTG